MDFSRYLNRISCAGSFLNDINSLGKLMEQHLYHVPFENIDIQYGVPISLAKELFLKKIVDQQRGGYCYELNGLFHWLLTELQFDAHFISGRVVKGKSYGPEFDHLAIIVSLNNCLWLVDVGFGDFSCCPLKIEIGLQQSDGRNTYLIREEKLDGQNYLAVCKWSNSKRAYQPEYYFTTKYRMLEEFEAMNRFHQTSEHSHFIQNLICSLPISSGRVSVINNRFIIKENNQRMERKITEDQLSSILRDYFQMDVALTLKNSSPKKHYSHTERLS